VDLVELGPCEDQQLTNPPVWFTVWNDSVSVALFGWQEASLRQEGREESAIEKGAAEWGNGRSSERTGPDVNRRGFVCSVGSLTSRQISNTDADRRGCVKFKRGSERPKGRSKKVCGVCRRK